MTKGKNDLAEKRDIKIEVELLMVLANTDGGQSGADFDIPSLAEAIRIERANELSVSSFYDCDAPASSFRAGELIRVALVGDYDLPTDIRAVRILYRSTSRNGDAVIASAFVLVPALRAPVGGWPIIAWAHGTSGVARQCAPSLMKNLYYGSVLHEMVHAGFAVVATDYHGLGSSGRHPYMDRVAQANDVIHSVPAAQAAVAELGRDWFACGHSQGGLAAWTVAEAQDGIRDPHYKGAVAAGAATHLPRLLVYPEEAKGAGYYFAWHAFAIATRFPQFDPASMLSETGMTHYDAVCSEGCWLYGLATYADVDDVAMLRPGWNQNEWVRRFYLETAAGSSQAHGPILVIAGEADTAVPIAGIEDSVRAGRAHGQDINFKVFPGLDHDPAMNDTVGFQLQWMRARLAENSLAKAAANQAQGEDAK